MSRFFRTLDILKKRDAPSSHHSPFCSGGLNLLTGSFYVCSHLLNLITLLIFLIDVTTKHYISLLGKNLCVSLQLILDRQKKLKIERLKKVKNQYGILNQYQKENPNNLGKTETCFKFQKVSTGRFNVKLSKYEWNLPNLLLLISCFKISDKSVRLTKCSNSN